MNREEAIAAIQNAKDVFAFVRISTSDDGSVHHGEELPLAKDAAIGAICAIRDPQHKPNVSVSEDGAKVLIGLDPSTHLPETFSHFESNNGNF